MKVQENKIENKKVIQIYLSEDEKSDTDIQEKIKQIKAENRNVVLFVSGDKEPRQTLKEMVKIMKNTTIKNCWKVNYYVKRFKLD